MEHTDVPAGPAVTVYRVVQEALSNAARHAPGSTVQVTVRLADDCVRVGVHNTAATRPGRPDPAPDQTPGNGLTGMRERVTALGGTLNTGPPATAGSG